MAENFGGMSRLIRNLQEEIVELEAAGMFDEADKLRERLQVYIDMRNKAHLISENINE